MGQGVGEGTVSPQDAWTAAGLNPVALLQGPPALVPQLLRRGSSAPATPSLGPCECVEGSMRFPLLVPIFIFGGGVGGRVGGCL